MAESENAEPVLSAEIAALVYSSFVWVKTTYIDADSKVIVRSVELTSSTSASDNSHLNVAYHGVELGNTRSCSSPYGVWAHTDATNIGIFTL